MIDDVASTLLPTPRSREGSAGVDYTRDQRPSARGHGDDLTTTVAMLPTPSTRNSDGNGHNNRGEPLLPGVATDLLPSPVVQDADSARNSTARRITSSNAGHEGDTLLDALVHLGLADPADARHLVGELSLLPTPSASQNGDDADPAAFETRRAAAAARHHNNGVGTPLGVAVRTEHDGPAESTADGEWVRWGKYRAAVKRTEAILGRLAPSPTKPDGRGGKRRLAARFVEWMMLLTEGWVTGVPGLTRREMLRLLGNGVIPPQASAATVILLDRVEAQLRSRP